MTTIIATPDALYSDSLITGNPIAFKSEKLYRIGDSIIGCAGTTYLINDWLECRRKRKKFKMPTKFESPKDKDLVVLIVNKKGIFHMDTDLSVDPVNEPYMAIGSGAQAACGALRQQAKYGASRENPFAYDFKVALEIAAEIDECTRLPMQVMYLDPKRTA